MIIFDISHGETHPNNFKTLCRRLRAFTKVQVNKESLSSSDKLKDCELLVVSSPQTQFVDEELRVIKDYVNNGGSLAVFSSEGGSQSPECNLNELLEDYSISIDDKTTVVRCSYHTYLHPTHALIQNGIVQPEIGIEKYTPLNDTNRTRQQREQMTPDQSEPSEPSMSLSFVYPNGSTLSVQSPAYTLLSSGSTSYPVDCPISAVWEGTNMSGEQGRVLVIASSDIFTDKWIDKEENSQLCDVLFRFLLRQNVSFDPSTGRSDFEEQEFVPDVASLSYLVKPCPQENAPLPQDYKSLICDDLFGAKNDYVPDVVDTYKKLNVPYEPLKLVQPKFACPQPRLRMATHQPRMLDPPPPALELFDLDECFLDVRTRLTQLQIPDDKDLDHFIQDAGHILGMDGKSSKEVLFDIGTKIFQHKMEDAGV